MKNRFFNVRAPLQNDYKCFGARLVPIQSYMVRDSKSQSQKAEGA